MLKEGLLTKGTYRNTYVIAQSVFQPWKDVNVTCYKAAACKQCHVTSRERSGENLDRYHALLFIVIVLITLYFYCIRLIWSSNLTILCTICK